MEDNRSELPWAEADARLTRAIKRLRSIRNAALQGLYDPAAFEQAVHEYNQVRLEIQRAQERGLGMVPPGGAIPSAANATPAGRSPSAPRAEPDPSTARVSPGQVEAGSDAGGEPFTPTPHMRFIRWLVESHRLSEWSDQ